MAERKLWCRIFGCKEITTASGYPAWSRVWHSYKECTRCGHKVDEIDDLFAPPRPEDWPLSKNLMLRHRQPQPR